MNILLINPPNLSQRQSFLFKKIYPGFPPIGLLYLGAYLEEVGAKVTIFDMFVEQNNEEQLFQLLEEKEFLFIGFSVLTASADYSLELSKRIKEKNPNQVIVWGNSHATFFAQSLLKRDCIDIISKGEGELVLKNLAVALRDSLPIEKVKGLVLKNKGEIIDTGEGEFVENLDELHFPAAHLLDWETYTEFPLFSIKKERWTLIHASRGCPYQCYFCAQDLIVKQVRHRSVENVLDEMEFMLERHGIRSFAFSDAYFPFSLEYGMKFSEALIARGLHKKVRWLIETRVDKVDFPLLQKMKEAGLYCVMYGIETPNASMLHKIGKRTNAEQAILAIDAARKAGLFVGGLFVLGMPGETEKDCKETIAFAKSLSLSTAKFNVLIPYPGTKFFKDYCSGIDWSESLRFDSWYNIIHSEDKKRLLHHERLLSPERLASLQRYAMLSFYIRPKVVLHLMAKGFLTPLHVFFAAQWIVGGGMMSVLRKIFRFLAPTAKK